MEAKLNDILNIREHPSHTSRLVGQTPANGKCIEYLGNSANAGGYVWIRVEYAGPEGWANSAFLTEDYDCFQKAG